MNLDRALIVGLALTLPIKMIINVGGASLKISPSDFIILVVVISMLSSTIPGRVPIYILPILPVGFIGVSTVLVSNSVNPAILLSLIEYVKLLASASFGVAMFALLTGRTHSKLWTFSVSSVFVSSIISVHAIIQKYLFGSPRPNSVFENANLFASYLVFNIFLLIHIGKTCDSPKVDNIAPLGLIGTLLTFGVFVTGSRSAAIGPPLAAILTYILFRDQISKIYRIGLVITTGVVGVILLSLNRTLLLRLAEPFTGTGDLGLGSRVELWSRGISAWMESPLTGIGYNLFEYTYEYEIGLHNTYLTYLVELGPLGLLMFLLMVGLPIRDSIRFSSIDVRPAIFSTFLTFLLIHGLFHGVDNYRTLWVSIGAIAAVVADKQSGWTKNPSGNK